MHEEREKAHRLNIVLKISERCNLKCDYCYFFFAGDDSWKRHPPVISPRIVEGVGKFAQRSAQAYEIPRIRLIFHGGEPLLMKKAAFDRMCQAFRAAEDGFRFTFALQTNAMLVDEDWIGLFEKHDVGAAISLDGPAQVNDRHRFDKRNRGSHDAAVAGYFRLLKAYEQGRIDRPNILAVVDPEADGAEVYRYFVDVLGCRRMNFLQPDLTWDAPDAAQVIAGVNRYLLAASREWFRDNNPAISVRMFGEIISSMISDEGLAEAQQNRSDYRNIVSVSSDGSLGPEDTLRTMDVRFAEMGLNVWDHSLGDLFASGIWAEQAEAVQRRPDRCSTCGWWNACRGGRPIHRFSQADGMNNPSIYCEGLKDLYADIAAFLVRSGQPMSVISERMARENPNESNRDRRSLLAPVG